SPRIREQVANYYNCLARLDDGVAMLLKELDKAKATENTLVIYFGDHGAQFPRGKGTVYEGGLRVPLIVRWPGKIAPGIVRKELVSTIDLLPTVLSAVGVSSPPQLPGRPLQPLFSKTSTAKWRRYNFGFTTGSFPRACFVQHSIRDERFKLISNPRPGTDNLDAQTYLDPNHQHFVISGATPKEQANAADYVQAAFRRWSSPPRYELYDLKNDPYEWENVAMDPQFADEKARLISALKDWQVQTRDPFLIPEHVNAYVKEQLANRDLVYRKQKDFRWSYIADFKTWRSAQAND
ncbi:MAG: sulfatase-like hydrolase/transferase, partial [Planctomycetaceae bacterium]|nr:sulfatase-like hydrolase/transferase [Planctomycetaceae bacterium]